MARLTLTAELDVLPKVAAFLEEEGLSLGFPEEVRRALELAVDEAVTNVISYAYPEDRPGPVTVILERQGSEAVVVVEDEGPEFNLEDAPDPDLDSDLEDRRVGGLGLYFIHELMDRVEHTRQDDRNHLEMAKKF